MPHAAEYHEFDPSSYPPFPSGPDYPTIDLETVSLKKLLDHDEAEEQRVFEICCNKGFFYLHLADCEQGEAIEREANQICRIGEQFFAQPLDEKLKYKLSRENITGYKYSGSSIIDAKGTADTRELINLGKDDFILPAGAKMSREWPDFVMRQRDVIEAFTKTAHTTTTHILDIATGHLGIPQKEIDDRHRLDEPAGSRTTVMRGPPRQTEDMPETQCRSHTDFGSVTLLINYLGGLQIFTASERVAGKLDPDQTGEWLWVEPRKGCAVVNLGDSAVKFSNGALSSGRHRVLPAPGKQGQFARYSIAYFLTPEFDCIMERLDGKDVPPLTGPEEKVTVREWLIGQSLKMGLKF